MHLFFLQILFESILKLRYCFEWDILIYRVKIISKYIGTFFRRFYASIIYIFYINYSDILYIKAAHHVFSLAIDQCRWAKGKVGILSQNISQNDDLNMANIFLPLTNQTLNYTPLSYFYLLFIFNPFENRNKMLPK